MENTHLCDNDTLLAELMSRGGTVDINTLPEIDRPTTGSGPAVPAAVVAPLILPSWDSSRSQAKLLYIKRSRALRQHSGQIAFPGGVMEKDDPDLLAAGYREGNEEVGLVRQDSQVVATLPGSFTHTGFFLQPYFIATTQQQFVAEPAEVESIHLVSVEELLECPVRIEHREWKGQTYRVIYFDTSSICIWGITGGITEILLRHFFDWTPKT